MIKKYSELSVAIDLIIEVYQSYNPIVIVEFCEQDLDVLLTIDQVIDYLQLHYNYTFEEEYVQYY